MNRRRLAGPDTKDFVVVLGVFYCVKLEGEVELRFVPFLSSM